MVARWSLHFGSFFQIRFQVGSKNLFQTGGQDDLLTIFSPSEQRVIARCQGHSSFVSAVAFDDLRSDGRTYRFGSVGEDNKLILWDFSSGALHRPKLQAIHHHRMSMSSSLSLAFRKNQSAHNLPGSSLYELDASPRYHPAPSRTEVSVVQPVLVSGFCLVPDCVPLIHSFYIHLQVKQLEGELPSVIQFLSKYMLTSSRTGHIKLWIRPLALRPRSKGSRAQQLTDISDIS
jgi:WD40 repeat protein